MKAAMFRKKIKMTKKEFEEQEIRSRFRSVLRIKNKINYLKKVN